MKVRVGMEIEVDDGDFDDLAQLESYIESELEDGSARVKVNRIDAREIGE